MRITDVEIEGFGAWSDLKLDHVSEGLTVFYGPNEAGKTTLMEFVRSVLYGYSAERRSRYLPPVAGGRGGGGLAVVGAGGRFTIRRTPGSLTGDDLGRVEVLSPQGSRQGQHVLGSLLSGIDEPIFNNVFAVGLRELQELGTLDDTEAAAHLYKLTSGLDRVSLIDVMRQLEAARNQILAADGSRSELLELIGQRDALRAEIKELAGSGQRWTQLAAQRFALHEELARLDENIDRMERESRAVEVAIQVRADWKQRVDVVQKLEKLGRPVQLPERAVERIDAMQKEIAEHRETIEQIKRRRRVIVEEANAQPINRQLWTHAGRIEALCEHAPWIGSLETQVKQLHEETDELQQTLRAQWERLGLAPGEIPEITPELSHRTLTALRSPARAVQDAQQRIQDAQTERDVVRRDAEEIGKQLQAELAETGETELERALDEAGHRVARFRRLVQLEERIEKLDRHRKELEQDRRQLLEEQVLPVQTLVWCGVPFVIGVAMILASFLWDWVAKLGWTVTILGFACWALAVVTKLLLEKSLGRDLDGCVRQIDKVKRQLRTLAEEREQLEQQLPSGGGPLDVRVKAAEQYVKRLEELTPLDAKRQAALNGSEATKEKASRAAEDLREAQQQWRAALRSVNLPESFRPEHIQQLSEGNDQTVQLGRRLQMRRQELQERETELTSITKRVEELMKDVHITAASSDPRTQLRQVAAAMAEQRQWIARRREIRQEHRELKRRFRDAAGKLRKLLLQRRTLLQQSHVTDDDQLRKLAQRQARIQELTASRNDLNQRIKLSIGSQCTEAAVGEVLQTHGEDRLESYWERLLARLQDAQSKLTQLHEHRGQMVQEMKTLSEDRRLTDAKLKLGTVEERIRRDVQRWRVLAVTSLMLEAIRQIYETERQPETLAEASTYLIRLTEGRYQRVWTPLSEDILRVDTANGESLPLDVLSQGTREAVFLSLRLALAAAYARRGALLPLVLDDVLVNLDVKRAKMAAEVLRDFATSGHQMMLFTCHHHILRIFQAAGVEVRLLPVRNGMDQSDWADENELLEPPTVKAEAEEEVEEIEEIAEFAEPVEEDEEAEVVAEQEAEPEAASEPEELDEEEEQEEPEEVEEVVEESEEELEVEEFEEEDEIDETSMDDDDEDLVDQDEDFDDPDEAARPLWDDLQELRLADDDRYALQPAGADGGHYAARWWEQQD